MESHAFEQLFSSPARLDKIKLNYQNDATSGDFVIATSFLSPPTVDLELLLPKFEDLPRRSKHQSESIPVEQFPAVFEPLASLEMMAGRVAIVVAIALVLGEVTTGLSFAEQISAYL
jgi:hypothetical protein